MIKSRLVIKKKKSIKNLGKLRKINSHKMNKLIILIMTDSFFFSLISFSFLIVLLSPSTKQK